MRRSTFTGIDPITSITSSFNSIVFDYRRQSRYENVSLWINNGSDLLDIFSGGRGHRAPRVLGPFPPVSFHPCVPPGKVPPLGLFPPGRFPSRAFLPQKVPPRKFPPENFRGEKALGAEPSGGESSGHRRPDLPACMSLAVASFFYFFPGGFLRHPKLKLCNKNNSALSEHLTWFLWMTS